MPPMFAGLRIGATLAVIGVAESFEMFCVAQNVETASDAEVLTTLGVDCLQGYHLGVPTLTPPWRQ